MGKTFKRILSVTLSLVMAFALAIPALANVAENSYGVVWQKVDNGEGGSRLGEYTEQHDSEKYYAADEIVRVSIVLEGDSVMASGYKLDDIASNTQALTYRKNLTSKQNAIASRISKQVLGGEKLDVVWHLTLAANIISANVAYGTIPAIKKVSGVKDVFMETQYDPQEAEASDSPNMTVSTGMTNSTLVYESGYTGAGSIVAIVDTGLDTTHELFDPDAFDYAIAEVIESGKEVDLLTVEEIDEVLTNLHAYDFMDGVTADDLYLNSKLPFTFNYIDGNLNVGHLLDQQGEHGSHVAGIAAANRYMKNEKGKFVKSADTVYVQGQAPDAQVLVMKVFGQGGGAYDSDYMAAVEDAIMLGADSVNLSLGSGSAGFPISYTYADVYEELRNSSLTMVVSSGNNSYWSEQTIVGYNYLQDKNLATDGSPGTFTDTLTVASVDNDGIIGYYFEYEGEKIFYTETSGYGNSPMNTISGEYEFVYVDSFGTDEEFAAVADILEGKIAICNRGSTSFYQKANAAIENGAVATIIANNISGVINMNLSGYQYTAPAVSILMSDGEFIKDYAEEHEAEGFNYYTGKITVAETLGNSAYNSANYTMSSFSSWGVPGNLTLKPEITAPGGSIYSINGAALTSSGITGGSDQYEIMSGTSMAAPQVAGIVALFAQYIRENDLVNKTGISERQLVQSLLMSTAQPLIDAESGNYYPVMQQGAGLADILAATSAKSYIMMGEEATASAADGKVKVEIGENYDGKFSFSFTVNNFSDEESAYDLSADFFTQDYFRYYVLDAENQPVNLAYYMDTWTIPLYFDVTWTINGEEYENGANLVYDFDGDGKVGYSDAQAILQYVVDDTFELNNIDYADINEDGEITSYDAYLALEAIQKASFIVESGKSAKVEVSAELYDIADYDLNGAYIEGYVFATEQDTEDGAIGVTHSIPVLGYYGNFSDSTMFDYGGVIDYYYDTDGYVPYMATSSALGEDAYTVKGFYYTPAGEKQSYAIMGNPLELDEDEDGYLVYRGERNALNANDTLTNVSYTLIRNGEAGIITVTDQNGKVLYSKTLGQAFAAYYYPNLGIWRNTSTTQSIGYTPGDAVNEGDVLTASITYIPPYYFDEEGNVDWDALGDGISYSVSYTIDNTAPVINDIDVSYNSTQGGFDSITIHAQDNQYIAAVYVTTESGETYGTFGSDTSDDAVAGASFDYFIDLASLVESGVIDSLLDVEKHILIEVYDYAGNCSTYKLNLNGAELNGDIALTMSDDYAKVLINNTYKLSVSAEPWGADETVTWSSSDESIATVNDKGIITAVSEGIATITATSVKDPKATAECQIEVFAVYAEFIGVLQDEEGYPVLFDWDIVKDSSWISAGDLDHALTAAVWDWNEDDAKYFYQQDFDGYIYQVDIETLETVDASEASTAFGAPMEDIVFPYYYNEVNGTHMVFGVYGAYLLMSDDIMDNTFDNGYNLASYLRRYTGASQFVAIAWGGASAADACDYMYALDNAGYLWELTYSLNGGLGFGILPTDLSLTYSLIDYTTGNSLVLGDDDNFYLAHFTGTTVELYQLAYDVLNDLFVSTKLGDVGDDVWPAALLMVLDNTPEEEGEPEEGPEFIGVDTLTAADTVELQYVPETVKPNKVNIVKSGINAVDSFDEEAEDSFKPAVYTEDSNVTNGKITITFDPDRIIPAIGDYLDSIKINAKYYAAVYDGEGSITIAYADPVGINAGEPIAEIYLVNHDTYDNGKIAVNVIERNDEKPNETVEYTLPESGHVFGEPVWFWSDDGSLAAAEFTCLDGDAETTVIADVESVTNLPACEEDGSIVFTASVVIKGVKFTDTKTIVIPATGHTYGEPVWAWTADATAATAKATFTCTECEDDKVVEATITSATNEATHTAEGSVVYTATVEFEGVTYTDTKTIVIPATGHTYGDPVWTWADDGSLATAKFTCTDEDSEVLLNATITSVITAATHTADGSMVYTANVTFGGKDYTDTKTIVLKATGHTYGEPVWAWTADETSATAKATFACVGEDDSQTVDATITSVTTAATHTADGSIVYTAKAVFNGVTYTDTYTIVLEATGHTYDKPVWTWSDDLSLAVAKFICSGEDSEVLLNATITSVTTAATHAADGSIVYTATVEFESVTYTDTKTIVLPAIGHTYGEPVWAWTADETSATASASFVCVGEDDTQVIEATITSATTSATHTSDGSIVYTATAVFNGVTYTDTKTVVLEAIGHTYGDPVWSWTADETSATASASFACVGEDDTQVIEATIASVEGENTVTYTATVEFNGKTYTDEKTVDITPAADDFILGDVNGDGVVDAIDYAMAKRAVTGSFDLDEEQIKRADIDKDGVITAIDYAMIKRHVLGTYVIEG